MLHVAYGMCRSPLHLNGSFLDTDPEEGPVEYLGIRRQYHKRIHLGAGNPACIRCICGHRAPNAASCKGKVIAMKPRGAAPDFQPGNDQ
jgi:hypothetical protein